MVVIELALVNWLFGVGDELLSWWSSTLFRFRIQCSILLLSKCIKDQFFQGQHKHDLFICCAISYLLVLKV
jgi:hypothetical protein